MSTPDRIQPEYQTRDGRCFLCGKPSKETRLVLRKEDELEKDWLPQPCSTCIDKIEADERQGRSAVTRAETIERLLVDLSVPPLYAAATLQNFVHHGDDDERAKQEAALDFARKYVDSWPNVAPVVLFRGGPGSGKGHVAWSIAKALVERREVSARVAVLSDVIRYLRECWDTRGDAEASEGQRLVRYRRPDLLIIDEVSRHAFYGNPQQHLYDLVAWREVQCKPTILTTNEAGQALAELLGPALSSRALGWHRPLDFGNADFRTLRGMKGDYE
jgi:DNA replication protein DnaC